MCVPLWLWKRKEFQKWFCFKVTKPQFLCIDFSLVLSAAFAFRHIVVNQFQTRILSIFNEFASIYEKTPSNGSTKQFTRTLFIIFFFRKPRTSIFLSVFVVVRVTPCLLCKYKSYIAFSSLSLDSKTFTEWLSVTVNDTVQCLVNQCTSSEWYSSSLKVGLPIYVVRASAE